MLRLGTQASESKFYDYVWQIARPIDLRAAKRDDRKHPSRHIGVIRQERAPRLRRRSDAPEHVLRDSRLRGVEAYGPPRPEETKSDTHGRPERL